MAFCAYCGSAVSAGDRFCGSCGAPVTIQAQPTQSTPVYTAPTYTTTTTSTTSTGYVVVLAGMGTCERAVLIDLLQDTLGYSQTDAMRLIVNIPVKIAQDMGRRQARVVAQALAEYGAQVAVFDKYGNYTDLTSEADSSVYNIKTGEYLASTLAVLATISAANRVTEYVRYTRPSGGLLDQFFRTLFAPARPVHVRRTVAARPTPPPAPRPVSPAVKPIPRPVQQAPRPAAHNPAPAPHNAAPAKPAAPKPGSSPRPTSVKQQARGGQGTGGRPAGRPAGPGGKR